MLITGNIDYNLHKWIKRLLHLLIEIVLCLKSQFINAMSQQMVILQQIRHPSICIRFSPCQLSPLVIFSPVKNDRDAFYRAALRDVEYM